jgi:hypothetical protein
VFFRAVFQPEVTGSPPAVGAKKRIENARPRGPEVIVAKDGSSVGEQPLSGTVPTLVLTLVSPKHKTGENNRRR